MHAVAIPKKITRGEELVIIPRKEYERFLRLPGAEKKKKDFPSQPLRKGCATSVEDGLPPLFPASRSLNVFLRKNEILPDG